MLIWLICAIVFISLIVLSEILNRRNQTKQIRSAINNLNQRSANIPTDESIFVVMPVYRSAKIGPVLQRVFENAYCPNRVFIGIIEHRLPNTETAINEYLRTLRGSMSPSFIQNIRYRSGEIPDIYGASVARQEIIRHLYHGENFILCVHSHSWFLPNWDRILIKSLRVAHQLGAHVVSQKPLEISSEEDAVFLKNPLPTTFPVFDKFVRSVPVFKPRFVDHSHPNVFRVGIGSYRCLFASADVFITKLELHDPGIPFLSSNEADFLLSAELWIQGYQICCPMQSAIVHHSLKNEHFYSHKDVRNKNLKKLKRVIFNQVAQADQSADPTLAYVNKLIRRQRYHIRGFSEWLGLDMKNKQVSGRILMGLLPEFTNLEVVYRFGSVENFESIKQTISLAYQ